MAYERKKAEVEETSAQLEAWYGYSGLLETVEKAWTENILFNIRSESIQPENSKLTL